MADNEITLNQIAVMIEKVGADVKAVAEGHGVIRREMQEMKTELMTEIDTVKGAVKYLAKDLGEVKNDLGEVKEKVGRIERTLDAHLLVPHGVR
jgi:hypothetical protein